MNILIKTLKNMGGKIIEKAPRIADSQILINCSQCGSENYIKLSALHRQKLRGNEQYLCKSCAGKKGWNNKNRGRASKKTKNQWKDPKYAGKIIGKATAREIIDKSKWSI